MRCRGRLEALNGKELAQLCTEKDLATYGKKALLIARLRGWKEGDADKRAKKKRHAKKPRISGPGPESEAAAVDMETEEETQGEEEWEGEDTTDDEEGEGEDTTNDEGEDDPDAAALMAEAIDHMWM